AADGTRRLRRKQFAGQAHERAAPPSIDLARPHHAPDPAQGSGLTDEYPSARPARRWRAGPPSCFADGRRTPTGDAGALARLRRAESIYEAAVEPATFKLLQAIGDGEKMLERTALCAGVLAHVREDRRGLHPAAAVGGDSPAMSAL